MNNKHPINGLVLDTTVAVWNRTIEGIQMMQFSSNRTS
jgi:hypothetical protein